MSVPSNALSNAISQQQAQESTLLDEYGQPLSTPQDWSIGYTPPSDMGIETPLASGRNTSSVTDSSTPQDLLSSALNQPAELTRDQQTLQSISTFTGWLKTAPANIVSVLIGLVLIAGAVWGFSTVRDTVVETAKGATTLTA